MASMDAHLRFGSGSVVAEPGIAIATGISVKKIEYPVMGSKEPGIANEILGAAQVKHDAVVGVSRETVIVDPVPRAVSDPGAFGAGRPGRRASYISPDVEIVARLRTIDLIVTRGSDPKPIVLVVVGIEVVDVVVLCVVEFDAGRSIVARLKPLDDIPAPLD